MDASISLPDTEDYLNSMLKAINLSKYYRNLLVDHRLYPVTYFAKDL
jgi:hypothetical protein